MGRQIHKRQRTDYGLVKVWGGETREWAAGMGFLLGVAIISSDSSEVESVVRAVLLGMANVPGFLWVPWGIWTQGLMLEQQAFYWLDFLSRPDFCISLKLYPLVIQTFCSFHRLLFPCQAVSSGILRATEMTKDFALGSYSDQIMDYEVLCRKMNTWKTPKGCLNLQLSVSQKEGIISYCWTLVDSLWSFVEGILTEVS